LGQHKARVPKKQPKSIRPALPKDRDTRAALRFGVKTTKQPWVGEPIVEGDRERERGVRDGGPTLLARYRYREKKRREGF
jgi:hypothetical protein